MLEVGMTHEMSMRVKPEHSAARFVRDVPDVFASAAMIAFIEETCAALVAPYLEPGQTTVGTNFQLTHQAATPIGMAVTVKAQLVEIDRRRLKLAVEVYDEVEKVSEGFHERFIIDQDKFAAKVETKAQGHQ